MTQLYIKGIGMMIGMIFGAGIFALPYTFSQAGLFWGIVHFIIAFLILLFLHFLYGEVAFFTKGRHRFTGYVEIFLGKRAKQFAFLTTMASYYGTLLVYGLLAGLFLSNFWQGNYKLQISLIFFIIAALVLLLRMVRIAEINFYLTVPLFGFIIYLLFVSLPSIKMGNFVGVGDINANWFLPYGVWLFALGGFAALPEVRDIFASSNIKHFKRGILISLAVSALFYFLFIFAVWGVSGISTSKDALSGLLGILGQKAFLIGSLIGFLAVFTSYLALAIDMKNIFRFDYGISRFFAWGLTVVPPVILFFLGATDFVRILGIIGVLGLGTLGIFIIFMARNLRKRIKQNDPGDMLEDGKIEYSKPTKILQTIVLIAILAGVVYELWRIFG
ncbi:amino acid permease [Patescibacteria group bacterium]|nr:amino acid permease [Patescibacteria group bacterium]